MACEGATRRLAAAARLGGIAALAGKKAYYAGARLAALGLWRPFRHWRRASAGEKPSAPLPVLVTQVRVEPIPTGELPSGQSCAGCRAGIGQKQSLWYRLNGQLYCQDCAPAAARQVGATLVGPAAPAGVMSGDISRLPPARPAVLRPARLKVGLVENVAGYAVSVYGRDTGLSLVPEVKVEQGQVSIDQTRWFVLYNQAGLPIGGPFASIKAAQGLASLLVNFEWNKSVEGFDDGELQKIVAIGNRFRENIEFEQRLRLATDG